MEMAHLCVALDAWLCWDVSLTLQQSMDTITPVTDYIEGHFRRMSAGSLSDGDTLNMVGGEGGVQVDVVFYMVSNSAFSPNCL
jgi:hypothetical protein